MDSESFVDTRRKAWQALTSTPADASRVDDLPSAPPAAQRLLDRYVAAGQAPRGPIELEMEGEIKLGRWFPFTARQLIHPTAGFVWEAVVGWWWLRCRGGDAYWNGAGSLEFKLAGRVPLVHASGPDIDRSAAGRLAIESAVWCPSILSPQAGSVWRERDDSTATVTRSLGGVDHDITIAVNRDGTMRDVCMERWGNPDGAYEMLPFGASLTGTHTYNEITLVSEGTVGWWRGTDRQDEGEFFRFHILDAQPVEVEAARPR